MIRVSGIPIPTILLLLLVFGLTAVYASSDAQAQTTPPPFDPGGIFCLENFETAAECDGDPTPGVSTDMRSKFCIGWNADCTVKDSPVVDSNFGAVISFIPTDFTVPQGDTLQIGALVGRLESKATLGLINQPCNANIAVPFTLMNASTDTSDLIEPRPVGEDDVMTPLAEDANGNGIPDGIDKYPSFLAAFFDLDFDFGPDEIPYTADDDDGPLPPVEPRARLGGFTRIQNTWVSLHFLVFEPGVTLEGPDGFITLDPAFGYPSVTILQDPTVPAAQSSITGFCAPLLSGNVTFGLTRDNPCTPGTPAGRANCPDQIVIQERGYPLLPCETSNAVDEDGDGKINDGCPQTKAVSEADIPGACDNDISDDPEDSDVNDGCPQVGDVSEGGFIPDPDGCDADGNEASCVHRQNPANAGSFTLTTFTASQRDADGDGIPNGLDVCALIPNGEWNPRGVDLTNDTDGDGLPNACDPEPNVGSQGAPQSCPIGWNGADEDQDCFVNRIDNCPLDSALEDPNASPHKTNNPSKPIDADGDGIGDLCDPNVDEDDGAFVALTCSFPTAIGAGESTAPQTCIQASCAVGDDPVGCLGATAPAPGDQEIPTPTATVGPGTPTPIPTGTPTGGGPSGPGGVGGPSTGVGALAPAVSSIPAWATIVSALGGAGLLGSLGAMAARVFRRRQH